MQLQQLCNLLLNNRSKIQETNYPALKKEAIIFNTRNHRCAGANGGNDHRTILEQMIGDFPYTELFF